MTEQKTQSIYGVEITIFRTSVVIKTGEVTVLSTGDTAS